MAYCSKCGAQLSENAAFCASCGTSQGAPVAQSQSGLAENVAGLLCYAGIWLTGLIFLLIDKRPYVRFHAAQSLITFGLLHVARYALGLLFGFGLLTGGLFRWSRILLAATLFKLLWIAGFILWIVLMIRAYQGERFKLPIVGDFAENLAGK